MIDILGLALQILGAGYQAIVAERGAFVDSRALSLAKDIAKKMSSNNALKEKLTNAYNEKNSSLINSMFRGMGFGPRAESLLKQKALSDEEFQGKINKLNEENIELERAQQQANQAAMVGGSSISGNIMGSQTLNDIEQNIKGGATNA